MGVQSGGVSTAVSSTTAPGRRCGWSVSCEYIERNAKGTTMTTATKVLYGIVLTAIVAALLYQATTGEFAVLATRYAN